MCTGSCKCNNIVLNKNRETKYFVCVNSYRSYISRLFFQKAITKLDTQGKLQKLGKSRGELIK